VAAPAAAGPHTVLPGESLWSIGFQHGVSPAAVAAASGRPTRAPLPVGVTVQVPPRGTGSGEVVGTTGSDGATAQSSAGVTALGPGHLPASALLPVTGPAGTAYLRADAAEDFVALRGEARRQLGIELYPAGPISGYRTSAQQRELWRQAKTGMGSEAAAPGTSDHEDGVALDLAQPEMRQAVDQLGPAFGWRKAEAPREWWHVTYVGR
jgi:hypothetical protein